MQTLLLLFKINNSNAFSNDYHNNFNYNLNRFLCSKGIIKIVKIKVLLKSLFISGLLFNIGCILYYISPSFLFIGAPFDLTIPTMPDLSIIDVFPLNLS